MAPDEEGRIVRPPVLFDPQLSPLRACRGGARASPVAAVVLRAAIAWLRAGHRLGLGAAGL